MSLLDAVSRRGAQRVIGVLLATVVVSACWVGVPSAAAGVIRTIHVGGAPVDVSSDGTHVWVTNTVENTVSEIEASSGKVIRTIPVGHWPAGVSSDGTHVWVTNIDEGEPEEHLPGEATVTEIEASSGKVIRTIPVGNEPFDVSSDGTHVWVTNFEPSTVTEIEASSGKVIRTIPTEGVGVSSDGTHVWAAGEMVSEIEASSGELIRTIPVLGPDPWDVSSDGTHVWVTNEFENTVTEIAAWSGAVIRTIPVGSEPQGVSSDGTHVWVANTHENTVSELQARTAECTSNSGTITLKPGLTNTPSVQNVTIKGTLSGCTGEPFTKATYTATMKTQNSVSCVALDQEERVEGPAKFKWTPNAKASTGRLATALFEGETVAMVGEVLTGSYSPLTFTSEEMTEVFSGGEQCGEPHGKKAAKPVKNGTFEGPPVLLDE